ncbi:hypothetical protein MTR62_13075 [Novosphingobium sp. 1949]|uniref:Uncharacterized protein n=1 Tax=Novosphingobium organovorum TaxID=2930092 RepID=A0ABT0BFP9_9SPHN|nr:hypothetical protein [Novosphingobium organovorum]MCJ2183616.1 hypothetical protein [Novosphingobium organovorum]
MFAIGCLMPALLFIVGAILGAVLGGNSGSMWGAAIGVGVGCLIPFAMFLAARGHGRKR